MEYTRSQKSLRSNRLFVSIIVIDTDWSFAWFSLRSIFVIVWGIVIANKLLDHLCDLYRRRTFDHLNSQASSWLNSFFIWMSLIVFKQLAHSCNIHRKQKVVCEHRCDQSCHSWTLSWLDHANAIIIVVERSSSHQRHLAMDVWILSQWLLMWLVQALSCSKH